MRTAFIPGNEYIASNGKPIEILARSPHFVVFLDRGEYIKRKVRLDLFGDAEYILVPSGHPGMNYFCVADDKIS